MINGRKPALYEGLVLNMTEGGQRKVIEYTKGAAGIVKYVERAGRTGKWRGRVYELNRRNFWKGVESVKEQKSA